jgi:hypothetical protein
MKRQQVESSNLASIGYDSENQILEVEFKHGGIYQYLEVPENVFEKLMNADSHGVYFSANIRNEYEFIKL